VPNVTPGALTPVERQIMVLTSAAHFFTHLFMLVFPTVAVLLARDWDVPIGDLLELAAPGFALYGLMAMPFGIWSDRAPGSMPVVVGLLGMGAGSLLCAVAETRWEIAGALAVIGAFAAAYHPAGLGLISHGVRRREWALGINGSFGSGAVAVAPALSEILAASLGWRGAFVALGVPAIAIALLFAARPIRVSKDTVPPRPEEDVSEKLLTVNFAILCVGMTLGGLAYRGASVVLPTLFYERIDWIGHGVATSIAYSLAVVMNYVGGRLAERFEARRTYVTMHALSLIPVILTAWAWDFSLLLAAGLYAGFALGTQPAENTLVGRLSPPSKRGVAYGTKFTLAFGIGSLSVPLVGRLLATGGTELVMLTISGFVAGLVCVAVILDRRLRS
jgi:FSR family fosmidomycin resistance protein-like MFS transporter